MEKSYKLVKKGIFADMIVQYIETSLKIVILVLCGELLRRLYLVFRELFFYERYYEPDGRLGAITRRVFNVNSETMYFLLLLVLSVSIFIGMTKRSILPPLEWLPYLILYWLLMCVQLGHSHLSNAEWIRQSHGLDYGAGMASNYYHGYLRLILPSHEGYTGIKERIESYEAEELVTFATNRLVILVPNTMYVEPKIEWPNLSKEGVKPLHSVYKNRAGVERVFRNDVYKFKVNGKSFYVALEGATPMLSFYDSLKYVPSATNEMAEMKRDIMLKFVQHLRQLLNSCEKTRYEAEIILYNTYKSDGTLQDVGEVLSNHLLHVK